MPAGSKVAAAEIHLKAAAVKKGKKGRAADRYVYGALNNAGLMHGSKPTHRGLANAHQHPPAKTTTTGGSR